MWFQNGEIKMFNNNINNSETWVEVTYTVNKRRRQKLSYKINEKGELVVRHFSFVYNRWKDNSEKHQKEFVEFCKKHYESQSGIL